MKFIIATLSLFVLVFMTGSIIFALTETFVPQVLSTNAKAGGTKIRTALDVAL